MTDRDALSDDAQARQQETAETLQRVRKVELEFEEELNKTRQQIRENFEWWEKRFGEKVRVWRKARGWSQEDIAERMSELGFEMHQTTVAKIERGARPLRVSEAVALAQVFGVPALSVFQGPGPDDEPWSMERMREHIETISEALEYAHEQLRDRAKDVAYWETSLASMANALNRAAMKADNGELSETE